MGATLKRAACGVTGEKNCRGIKGQRKNDDSPCHKGWLANDGKNAYRCQEDKRR